MPYIKTLISAYLNVLISPLHTLVFEQLMTLNLHKLNVLTFYLTDINNLLVSNLPGKDESSFCTITAAVAGDFVLKPRRIAHDLRCQNTLKRLLEQK